ncbi:ABC transporter permease [Brevundimonas naejangsanensis]|uniref:ABC transporter permease n=1 Tax=Brevundimonas naejangsanensis TaxID=588932 RepID=A0A494RNU1_9CAUL|nr:ABC transporter permease [Brevundimonas naejangsanensis]AYG95314.1 ABC transporter permease [Brevundimonas naejangsanensis]
MSRILLIARREFLAYAKTVGFWLSLLALPLFGVLGGAIPMLMKHAEPVREAVIIDETPAGSGLAAAVRQALETERGRADIAALRLAAVPEAGMAGGDRVRAAAEQGGFDAGLEALQKEAPRAAASFKTPKPDFELVDAPADLAAAAPGEARDALARRYVSEDAPEGKKLNAVVFLTEADGKPGARVWTGRATDDVVEDAVRDALKSANRSRVFVARGIDPAVVTETEKFRPDVSVFSPRAASGGEVSFRDKLPVAVGLAVGFILWSLIMTGASILLNSVMEEKSNKILEVLLSSASATEILTGKVLGVALLTLTVLGAWGGIGAVGVIAAAPDVAREVGSVLLTNGLFVYFLLFLVGGYLMYAVLFAAIGAFCDTPRDAQTLMGPIMMVLIVPILVMQMAIRTPDALLVKVISLIPPFTPFVMAARAPSGPPLIEIIGGLVGMFLFAALMVWAAGRAFRAGALSDVKLSWKSFVGAVTGR